MKPPVRSAADALAASPVLQAWRDRIRAAAADGKSLVIVGGGSKSFYGLPVAGELLDTRDYRGIVDYEPAELVITAYCGTPLAEIEATLAERGQMLAFEPPRFGGAPTVGGVVACGLSGPRRMRAGATRDFVLGLRLMNGDGELLVFGGQVMKNVAGYDVPRMLTGSLGCFGLIAEVSLKVVPQPQQECTLAFGCDEAEALDRLNRWAGLPLPISASAWLNGVLQLRLSGAKAAVAAARRRLGGEVVLDDARAAAFWESLRDHTHPFFAPADTALVRIALPGTASPLALAEPQLIEWDGAQRWCRVDGARLGELRALVVAAGGHATLFRAGIDSGGQDVFTPLSAPLLRIHRALKRSFDPAGVFNRGRMYREL